MKSKASTYLLSIFLCSLCLCACSRMERQEALILPLADAPMALSAASSFSIGSTVYVVGGRKTDRKYSQDIYAYDVTTNEWSIAAQLPSKARVYPVAVVADNKAYIGLGYGGGSINTTDSYFTDFWQWDPSADTWTELAAFPDQRTNCATAFTLDGKIYVGLGFHGFSKSFFVYDIASDSWSRLPNDFPERCTGAVAATTTDGRAFVGTGFRHGGHSEWYEFDNNNQSWHKRRSVPTKGRHFAAADAVDDDIYMVGGWHYGDTLTGGFMFNDILRYQPLEDKWTYAGTLPSGSTMNMVASAVGNCLYFGLGEGDDEQPLNTFYRLENP